MMALALLSALLLQDPVFPDADPQPAIKAARKKAGENNRVVLILWGSNDNERSKEVATLLKKDKEIARLMLYEYDLVLADSSKADDATKRGNDKLPLPWMAFVAADGNSVGWWETPKDPAGLVEALKKNQRPPLVAKEVLAAAMKRAREEKKRVLMTFGAPW